MGLIKDRKTKDQEEILDSGYYGVFGDEELASLCTKVHGTTIVNGNELEKFIFAEIKIKKFSKKTYIECLEIINDNIGTPIYFDKVKISKDDFLKYSVKMTGKKNTNIDCIYYDGTTVYILELKDGASLDTKKSAKEVDDLGVTASIFTNEELDNEFGLVLWRCSDLKNSSIKTNRTDYLLKTGRDLSEMLGIDFYKIQKIRAKDQKDNVEFFITEMKKIITRLEK